MSYEHNRYALAAAAEHKLSARAAHVLLVLAVRSDANGCCHPSINTLAADVGRNRTNVMDAIAELEAAGLLDVERRDRRVNLYTVKSGGADATSRHPSSGGADATIRSTVGGAETRTGGADATRTGGADATPTTPELLIELAHAREPLVLVDPAVYTMSDEEWWNRAYVEAFGAARVEVTS